MVPRSTEEALRNAGYSKDVVSAFERVKDEHKVKPSKHIIEHENVIFLAVLPDDSASIKQYGNREAVIKSHNSIIDSLSETREVRKILYRTQYLNGFVLNNWVPLEEAKRMGEDNFKPEGLSPLYDATISMLGSIVSEKQRAEEIGQEVHWGLLIISDGDDQGSINTAQDVKTFTDEMKNKGELDEDTKTDRRRFPGSIAFMGVEDRETNYREVAQSMGINWILGRDKDDPRGELKEL